MKNPVSLKRITLLALAFGFNLAAHADGADEPIPSYYEEPGVSTTRDYVGQHANK